MDKFTAYYFLGIGGIGMSALARYFNARGFRVHIVFDGSVNAIPVNFLNPAETQVVLTPAIPGNHPQLQYFRSNGFSIRKRAEALGAITRNSRAICIAGTHGKALP